MQSREPKGQMERWMSANRHHRNSINVRIGDFAPVFWIAVRIKRLTLLDHVASWRSPEGGRAYWRTNERNRCRRDRDGRNGARKRGGSCAGKEGTRGEGGARKGKERTGQEDEGGTKYRRRTAVGIKRGDGRRCGGPTLFPVEDWTAPPSRRPSCPPPSYSPIAPSSPPHLRFARPRVRACVRERGVRVHVPGVLLYRPTLHLTSSPTRVPRARANALRRAGAVRALVRSLRRMTRRRATRRDHAQCSIGLSWPDLCMLRPCHNGTQNARHSAPECAELNVPRSPRGSPRGQASRVLRSVYCRISLAR